MISSQYSPDFYNGDGIEDTFDFTFRILQKSDLLVKVLTVATGVVVTLVLDTDYTIADAWVDADGGGEIVTTDPVATGDRIFLIRNTARTQLVNLVEGSPFPAATVTKVFDRLTMMIQELYYRNRQALKFRDVSTVKDKDVPDPQDGFFLGWLNQELANLEIDAFVFIGDTEAVSQDAVSFAVVFATPLADTSYDIMNVSFNWLTGWHYQNKTVNGFTIVFGNPAPAGAELVWRVKVADA
jgi:hypothetical protein